MKKNFVCENFARRRLSSIPQQDNFHVHSTSCSYEFNFEGDNTTKVISVEIKNQVKPLPIIGFISNALGILNENKNFQISCKSQQELRPAWVNENDSEKWVGSWL